MSEIQVFDGMTEARFQTAVQVYASRRGWLTTHIKDSRLTLGQAGAPDVMMVRRGQIILAELKSAKGRVSKAQKRWMQEYPDILVWRPSDWEEIKQILE